MKPKLQTNRAELQRTRNTADAIFAPDTEKLKTPFYFYFYIFVICPLYLTTYPETGYFNQSEFFPIDTNLKLF